MNDWLDFLQFFKESAPADIDIRYVFISAFFTLVIYLVIFLINRFILHTIEKPNFTEFIIKFSISFVVEFILIWLYGGIVTLLATVLGMLISLYLRNKIFDFIKIPETLERDMDVKLELSVLKSKFKKNPHYSILEVLLYYGYISDLQKEEAETSNIFKTPDEIAKGMLNKPMLTADQLDEAIGIMNMIRREGRVLTREEALLLILQLKNTNPENSVTQENNSDLN